MTQEELDLLKELQPVIRKNMGCAESDFVPRTALGKKLLDLRNRAIASGIRLLSEDEVLEEVRRRRGEDDCICPDCIHCDPVADECRKGRWRYPTDGCFDFVSRDGKETGLGEMLKRIKVVKND